MPAGHLEPDRVRRPGSRQWPLDSQDPGAQGLAQRIAELDIDLNRKSFPKDPAKTESARASYADNRSRLPGTLTAETESDDEHWYYGYWPALGSGNSKIALGVDIKSDGGCVISWPRAGYPVLNNSPIGPWPPLLNRLMDGGTPKSEHVGGALSTAYGTIGRREAPPQEGLKAVDPEALAAIVRQITNDERFDARDQWIGFAHALAAAFQDDLELGEELWLGFSAQREQRERKDGEAEPEYVWRTLEGPHKYGADYLMKLAYQRGDIDTSAYRAAKAERDLAAKPFPPLPGDRRDDGAPPLPVAGQVSSRKLHYIRARDIRPQLTANGTPVRDLLDDGAMSVVYGDSWAGKSLFCLDLAFHIATGRAWRGHHIKKQGCVVYIAAEGGGGISNRVAALKQHHGVSEDTDIPLVVVPCPVDLLRPDADREQLNGAGRGR